MPLKQTVIPLLDHVEPLAEVVGAVNTVLLQGRACSSARTPTCTGSSPRSAKGSTARPVGTAAVLGAGATAASTLAALAQLGCTSPVVYVRALARAGGLMRAAHRMGVTPVFRTLDAAAGEIGRADVVVSTLPPHAADALAAQVGRTREGVLLDVAYDPRPTALSVAWAAAGGVVVGGERMLLHQAAEQVRLMTGPPARSPRCPRRSRSKLAALTSLTRLSGFLPIDRGDTRAATSRPPARPEGRRVKQLGEILLDEGLVSEAQLLAALDEQWPAARRSAAPWSSSACSPRASWSRRSPRRSGWTSSTSTSTPSTAPR